KPTFITGNKKKIAEAKMILGDINFKELELTEIQSDDAKKVIEAKLDEALKFVNPSIFVEDTSLEFQELKGLPGPFTKYFVKNLGANGLWEVFGKMKNNKISAIALIGLALENGEKYFFEGRVEGKIVEPRGESGWGFDPIFEETTTGKTFAEMTEVEKNSISHRHKAFHELKKFLEGTYSSKSSEGNIEE
ncbi:MAG TPA: non-canonical purine NTP pyrophosphatase, partial [Candidatus Dojkabacteria bacterium]